MKLKQIIKRAHHPKVSDAKKKTLMEARNLLVESK